MREKNVCQATERIHFLGKINIILRKLIISILCFIQLLVLVAITETASAIDEAFTVRMSIQEEYNRSTGLTKNAKVIERSTVISPGLLLYLESVRNKINLDYEAGLSFVQNESSRKDSILHKGSCNWEYQLNRYLTLAIHDTFSRSEDRTLISDGQIEKVFNEREINNRNNGEASIFYQFGSHDRIGFGYRNRYEDSKAINTKNGTVHVGFLTLDTRFSPKINVNGTSSITRGLYKKTETEINITEDSSDFVGYEGGLIINYNLNQIKSLYGKYNLFGKDFDEPRRTGPNTPFWLHRGVLGLRMALSPLSEFHAEGGYSIQDFTNGIKRGSSTFDIGLSTRRKKCSIGFEGSSGFDQDYFSSDNMDSFKFHKLSGTFNYILNRNLQMSALASYKRENSLGEDNINNWKDESQVSASLNYQMTPNLHIVTSGNYRWQKYWGGDYATDKKDKIWLISGVISYTLRRWLILTLDGSHYEQRLTDTSFISRESRIMLRITATHPVFLKR